MGVVHDWDTSQPLLRKEKGFTGHNSGEDCLEYESQTTKKIERQKVPLID